MIVFAVICLAMLAKDILGTGVILFLGQGRSWLAGVCDALGDYAALFCVGATGAEVVQHGVSVWTVEALIGLGVGSLAGTVIGSILVHRLASKQTLTQQSVL